MSDARDALVALAWDAYASCGPDCPEDEAFAVGIDALLEQTDLIRQALGMHPVAMADTACGWVVHHSVEEAGAWSKAEPVLEVGP